ncbi:phytanoyl-CoA dioxygenase family protein [Thalassotalea psychrophila]|uniref:Phytanoyl-CoA dioxygenase family protein n=1 Tax=Thalassotalea psychrophila TaxID=3065647 RepID=A0ABY9TTL6_9GAMM|nr:phytanoyl-CoA dioxygenase family protein [Colwelliaceae bacterium SQ149]
MTFHQRNGEQYSLTNEDIIQYAEKGYVVLPDVISNDEIAFIEQWFDHFVAGNESHRMARDFCDMSQPYGTPIEEFQLVNAMLPSKYCPELANNIFHRVAQNITDQLYTRGKALLDYEQFLAKKPNKSGAEFAMHQDLGYWPKTANTWTATFSLAITPSTLENGCLQVISGSNKEPELRKHVPKPYRNIDNIGKTNAVSRDDSHLLVIHNETGDKIQHLPVTRGSVTVHDERIIHGSSGNLSDDWRKTYVMAFRDSETIKQERGAGFTHSHNDKVNWNEFIR